MVLTRVFYGALSANIKGFQLGCPEVKAVAEIKMKNIADEEIIPPHCKVRPNRSNKWR